MQKKLSLFANCIPVKGVNRSLICDLQRSKVKLIPNELYDLLTVHQSKSIEDILKEYIGFEDVVSEYIDFLLENEFVFLTETPDLFPKLDLSWFEPFEISNAIIEVENNSKFDFHLIAKEIDSVNCRFLELRLFNCKIDNALELLNSLNEISSIITSVEIIANSDYVTFDRLNELLENPRVSKIILYNCKEFKEEGFFSHFKIKMIKHNIMNSLCCGIINREDFVSNISMFTESQHHNTCLNRKISIDKNGNIKNCPSMPQSFGNIKDTTLEEALNHPDFKKYWNVTKDQIAVCKDCEFRHICTDCRAYTERTHFEGDIDLSKPLKCGYNPYTNEWAEWSTNPLKQKAIEYYGMQELVKG
jgi:SPASM domain peptide maturase of grasp-with-spasm system